MDFRECFKKIEEKKENGIWINLYNAKWKIAYFNNEEVLAFVRECFKKTGITDISKLPEDLHIELIVNHILKDWKNVEIDGKDTKYTKKRALDLLSEKENNELIYKKLLLEILEKSINLKKFEEVDETIIKK